MEQSTNTPLHIIAYLVPDEEGCNFSQHFKDHFINNTKLHPSVKAIKVKEEIAFDKNPEVTLFRGNVSIYTMRGSAVGRPDLLQEFILDTLNLN